MSQFKSKPTVIDAVLYTGENLEEVQAFCLVDAPSFFQPVAEEDRDDDPEIVAQVWDKLHSTWVGVKAGQYIIKGTKGEFYPCDPEVFTAKYEAVETEDRPLTFGEQAVGLTFNPSGDPQVLRLKKLYAEAIDILNDDRGDNRDERARLASVAITENQGTQMWAVKAVTYPQNRTK